ncbi:MAG TPA: WG repeat-containing protein, partial [Flavobacterium sp.]|nr:WG repeat-containing protein [Flavobacterium sp.]
MKNFFTLICIVLLTSCNYAQKDKTDTEGLIYFQDDNGKYGLKDHSGKIISMADNFWGDASYPKSFSEGLASVELNGKSGYIDTAWQVIIPLKFSLAASFSDGLAMV